MSLQLYQVDQKNYLLDFKSLDIADHPDAARVKRMTKASMTGSGDEPAGQSVSLSLCIYVCICVMCMCVFVSTLLSIGNTQIVFAISFIVLSQLIKNLVHFILNKLITKYQYFHFSTIAL